MGCASAALVASTGSLVLTAGTGVMGRASADGEAAQAANACIPCASMGGSAVGTDSCRAGTSLTPAAAAANVCDHLLECAPAALPADRGDLAAGPGSTSPSTVTSRA